jgi:hypothetical protein
MPLWNRGQPLHDDLDIDELGVRRDSCGRRRRSWRLGAGRSLPYEMLFAHELQTYAECEKMDEITGVVDAPFPDVSAFAAASGGAVVERIWTTVDDVADDVVGTGRLILRLVLGRAESALEVEEAVESLAGDPADEQRLALLRLRLRELLASDPALAVDLSGMLPGASTHIVASGRGAVAAHVASGSGPCTTGYNSPIQR